MTTYEPQRGAGEADAFFRLWTPHRMAYIQGENKPKSDDGTCPFCAIPALSDEEALIVRRGRAAFAVLNLYPYNPGHLMVCPYRHVADYTELTPDETSDVASLTAGAMRAIRSASGADGFNVGMNQGAVAGSRHRGPPASARGAEVGRGHELHARRRPHQGLAAAASRHATDPGGLLERSHPQRRTVLTDG
jgi:ATP adenylyltransferase